MQSPFQFWQLHVSQSFHLNQLRLQLLSGMAWRHARRAYSTINTKSRRLHPMLDPLDSCRFRSQNLPIHDPPVSAC